VFDAVLDREQIAPGLKDRRTRALTYPTGGGPHLAGDRNVDWGVIKTMSGR
jgi:hypothetical protein